MFVCLPVPVGPKRVSRLADYPRHSSRRMSDNNPVSGSSAGEGFLSESGEDECGETDTAAASSTAESEPPDPPHDLFASDFPASPALSFDHSPLLAPQPFQSHSPHRMYTAHSNHHTPSTSAAHQHQPVMPTLPYSPLLTDDYDDVVPSSDAFLKRFTHPPPSLEEVSSPHFASQEGSPHIDMHDLRVEGFGTDNDLDLDGTSDPELEFDLLFDSKPSQVNYSSHKYSPYKPAFASGASLTAPELSLAQPFLEPSSSDRLTTHDVHSLNNHWKDLYPTSNDHHRLHEERSTKKRAVAPGSGVKPAGLALDILTNQSQKVRVKPFAVTYYADVTRSSAFINPSRQEHASLNHSAARPRHGHKDKGDDKLKPLQPCHCDKKCWLLISEHDRMRLYTGLSSLKKQRDQDAYLLRYIRIEPKTSEVSHGSHTSADKGVLSDFSATRVEICRRTFMGLFAVGQKRLNSLLDHAFEHGADAPKVDGRGKHTNRANRVPPDLVALAKQHMLSFPVRSPSPSAVEHGDGITYLSPDLNVQKMYRMFLATYQPVLAQIEQVAPQFRSGAKSKPKHKSADGSLPEDHTHQWNEWSQRPAVVAPLQSVYRSQVPEMLAISGRGQGGSPSGMSSSSCSPPSSPSPPCPTSPTAFTQPQRGQFPILYARMSSPTSSRSRSSSPVSTPPRHVAFIHTHGGVDASVSGIGADHGTDMQVDDPLSSISSHHLDTSLTRFTAMRSLVSGDVDCIRAVPSTVPSGGLASRSVGSLMDVLLSLPCSMSCGSSTTSPMIPALWRTLNTTEDETSGKKKKKSKQSARAAAAVPGYLLGMFCSERCVEQYRSRLPASMDGNHFVFTPYRDLHDISSHNVPLDQLIKPIVSRDKYERTFRSSNLAFAEAFGTVTKPRGRKTRGDITSGSKHSGSKKRKLSSITSAVL